MRDTISWVTFPYNALYAACLERSQEFINGLLRSVIGNRPKVLIGRSQNGTRGGSSVASTDDGDIKPRRTIGRSRRPIRFSRSDNRVSPTRPACRKAAVFRPQG